MHLIKSDKHVPSSLSSDPSDLCYRRLANRWRLSFFLNLIENSFQQCFCSTIYMLSEDSVKMFSDDATWSYYSFMKSLYIGNKTLFRYKITFFFRTSQHIGLFTRSLARIKKTGSFIRNSIRFFTMSFFVMQYHILTIVANFNNCFVRTFVWKQQNSYLYASDFQLSANHWQPDYPMVSGPNARGCELGSRLGLFFV